MSNALHQVFYEYVLRTPGISYSGNTPDRPPCVTVFWIHMILRPSNPAPKPLRHVKLDVCSSKDIPEFWEICHEIDKPSRVMPSKGWSNVVKDWLGQIGGVCRPRLEDIKSFRGRGFPCLPFHPTEYQTSTQDDGISLSFPYSVFSYHLPFNRKPWVGNMRKRCAAELLGAETSPVTTSSHSLGHGI